MRQKSYCRKIVEILIQRAHPEIIGVHSRLEKNFRIRDELQMNPISCHGR